MQGIYKLEFKDGSVYIGQAKDIRTRFTQHLRDMESGKHHNKHVQAKFQQFGFPATEVLEYVQDIKDLDPKEQQYIKEYTSHNLLNIRGSHYESPEVVEVATPLVELYTKRTTLASSIDTLEAYLSFLGSEATNVQRSIVKLKAQLRCVDTSIVSTMGAVISPQATKISAADATDIFNQVRDIFRDVADPKLQQI